MADGANTPLLDRESRASSPPRSPSTRRSSHSHQSARFFELSDESTPLLLRRDDDLPAYGTEPVSATPRTTSPDRSLRKPNRRVQWPTLVFLSVLNAGVLGILIFAFAAPAVVKEYAEEAAVFQPTALSIDSATPRGVRARVQGNFVLDSRRVHKKSVRDFGRFATWIAREVETGQSEVQVYLPEYGNVVLGTASVPSIKVNIRNGHPNQIDFLADLAAGDLHGIRAVADDWIEGRLGRLRVKGTAKVPLKSGLLSLGTQLLSDTLTFEEKDFPALPEINITKLNVHDTNSTAPEGAMAMDVSLAALFDSPFTLVIPPLGFKVLVPNCSPGEPYIMVANASTKEVNINPGSSTDVDVAGVIGQLPAELTTACPGKKDSPLDLLVMSYIQGLETTIYVRGADAPTLDTPEWMVDLLKGVTVPLPFTGHSLDNLVKNFSMSDVHFSLPDPFAEPGTPDAQPKVSALVKVLINMPDQINLKVDVPRVRANADVYYRGDKLGVLDLHKWQPANSSLIEDADGSPALFVEFPMKDAPLQVTDEDTFTEVIQALIFGKKPIVLRVAAVVDAEVTTGLGQFAIHSIPAEGKVPVKPPHGDPIDQLNARVEDLELGTTSESSILVRAKMNFTNPTQYSATVPLVDFALLYNGTAVAHVAARDVSVVPGMNSGVRVDLLWSPLDSGGKDGVNAGREMLSQYVSGVNTTVTVQSHRGTIPALPRLGQAMSKLGIQIQIPKVPVPRSPVDGDGDDDDNDSDGGPHFIQDATLHLWSSTAEFTLASPLSNTTILITSIDATAFYDTTEPIGKIDYNLPFEVPPGITQTPRLPVDLDLGGIGYDALKKALGGTLKMDAVAKIGVRIRQYTDTVIYHGKGIGAKIRI